MTKPHSILTSLITVFILCGCGDFEPEVDFIAPIKGLSINLSNKVGDSFQILRDTDTIKYSLSFEKATKFNYLIKSEADTVFVGTITRKNEFFLLNRPLNNGRFAIHALKFTDSTVVGLETEWLQSAIINNVLESGKYTNLIIDTIGAKTLQVNVKEGKEIFRQVIEQLEPEKLLFNEVESFSNDTEQEVVMMIADKLDYKKDELIKKVYPNPFEDQVTIELTNKSLFIVRVFDLKGVQIMTLKKNTKQMKIAMPYLISGTYILQVRDEDTKTIDEIKLVKK